MHRRHWPVPWCPFKRLSWNSRASHYSPWHKITIVYWLFWKSYSQLKETTWNWEEFWLTCQRDQDQTYLPAAAYLKSKSGSDRRGRHRPIACLSFLHSQSAAAPWGRSSESGGKFLRRHWYNTGMNCWGERRSSEQRKHTETRRCSKHWAGRGWWTVRYTHTSPNSASAPDTQSDSRTWFAGNFPMK